MMSLVRSHAGSVLFRSGRLLGASIMLVAGTTAFAGNSGVQSSDAILRAAEGWLIPKPHSPASSAPRVKAPKPDPNEVMHIPGSAQAYTRAQTEDMFVAPDWWPQDHPLMPQIVAHGRGHAWPCARCHLPTGLGRPEDAATAGLPYAYIIEQIQAFRDGERSSPIMHEEASHLGDADLKRAAVYFSSLRFSPWTKVIETATIPKMHREDSMWVPTKGAGREPIGKRIFVTPVNLRLTELGDTRSGYIAYVPPGSIAAGAKIAAHGVNGAPACESCHGAKLRGVGMIPPLAGRMPDYLARELLGFRVGRRTNPGAAPMRAEVSHLTLEDMIDVAAYAASQKP